MSFNWNLSSDSEEEHELDERMLSRNTTIVAEEIDQVTPALASGASAMRTTEYSFSDDDDDEDDGDIGWEDGGGEPDTPELMEPVDDRKVAAAFTQTLLRPVTINMNQQNEPPAKKRRKLTRRRFRIESLPKNMQLLLRDLHRTNLLAMASRACFLSSICAQHEVLAAAHSLLPRHLLDANIPTPNKIELKRLVKWYHDRIHRVVEVRRRRARANVAHGAPAPQPRQRNGRKQRPVPTPNLSTASCDSSISINKLLMYCDYLSPTHDDDPQIRADGINVWTKADQTLLFLAVSRSMGWRTRLVMNIDPIKQDLDVDHPLLSQCKNIFRKLRPSSSAARAQSRTRIPEADRFFDILATSLLWVEVFCREPGVKGKDKTRWVHVDPFHALVDCSDQVEILLRDQQSFTESKRLSKRPIAYALGVEHKSDCLDEDISPPFRMTDVTPRYAESWVASLRVRGAIRNKKSLVAFNEKDSWWSATLQILNHPDAITLPSIHIGKSFEEPISVDSDDNDKKLPAVSRLQVFGDDEHETDELERSASDEVVPTSKTAFQTHPVFVLPSLLGKAEVLAPDAKKRIKGVFKGELIYLRSDVSTALPAKKWLYSGRKVNYEELPKPIKRVKTRQKPVSKNFKPLRSYGVGKGNDGSEEQRAQDIARAETPLDDGMDDLYAIWQTMPWSPPHVGPGDRLPVNEFGNIELALLNPGLVHVAVGDSASVAKRLHIPYAPCLVGFEGQGGNRTPSIRGIIVHAHNEQLIREGSIQLTNHALVKEAENRERTVQKRWKSLMHALLVKDRIERDYA